MYVLVELTAIRLNCYNNYVRTYVCMYIRTLIYVTYKMLVQTLLKGKLSLKSKSALEPSDYSKTYEHKINTYTLQITNMYVYT